MHKHSDPMQYAWCGDEKALSESNPQKKQWLNFIKHQLFVNGHHWQQKAPKPSVKHGGGSLMLWGCFVVCGPEVLVKKMT